MQVKIRIPHETRPRLGASSRVALGILASRLTGLARERVIAHYFGNSAVADAFRAAIRVPNLLNNLFGEGVLSASFITVYAKLRARGLNREADHLAGAIFGILALLCAAMVLLGVAATPLLVDVFAFGFEGGKRALTVRLVRILFPGTGLLVMSAWCLGILNSHRRFLLSYMAPIAVNATMIAALAAFGPHSAEERLATYLAWASVLGSAIQFLIQIPSVIKIIPGLRPALEIHSEPVRAVIRSFGPVFLSRGVVQISATIDSAIASLLPTSAVAALGYGQIIAVLPVSLFSMSVSAAELPTLSSATGTHEEISAFLRTRLSAGLRRIAFFVIPSAAAFLILGDVLAGALYQSGRFHHEDALYVWSVLAGSAVGLLATSLGRLYSSAFYALLDTRAPLRFAIVRVLLTTALGYLFAIPLPHWLHINPKWGIAGLTASAGIAGWVEFTLLRRGLARKIGATPLAAGFTVRLWSLAFIGAAAGYLVKLSLGWATHPILLALVVLSVYAAIYLGGAYLLGIEESRSAVRSITRRL